MKDDFFVEKNHITKKLISLGFHREGHIYTKLFFNIYYFIFFKPERLYLIFFPFLSVCLFLIFNHDLHHATTSML